MFRFIEYNESCVRIPAKISGIPSTVCKIPVISPASIPATNATATAATGFHPFNISITVTTPPVAIVPSTVRSAKSSILNVKNTPIAIIPQIRPWATEPGSARTSAVISCAHTTGIKLYIFSSVPPFLHPALYSVRVIFITPQTPPILLSVFFVSSNLYVNIHCYIFLTLSSHYIIIIIIKAMKIYK